MEKSRGSFGRFGFILAAAGSAIGLGNIWKFPYITYENNGGSFVLIYLVAVALVGLPVMISEIIIGRSTQKSPVSAFLQLGGKLWSPVGWLGIGTGFVILSYYSVIAGWTIHYTGKCLSWSLRGFTETDATTVGQQFSDFLANGNKVVLFHGLFMLATVAVVVFGVRRGIERITKILMPILILILVLLVVNSTRTPGFSEAMRFLFVPGSISSDSILEAVGHAFFTLSLGMGAMITYGSYVSRRSSIPRSALSVVFLDTAIALMASVIMFSIIFSVPMAERADQFSESSTILFTTLPQMFYNLPGGNVIAPAFYIFVAFAALTSTISLLEVVVSLFIDQFRWPRKAATALVGLLIFAFGVPSALSFGANTTLSTWTPLGDKSEGFFGTFDYLSANWFLPVGGIFIAIFAGWYLTNKYTKDELEEGHGPFRYHAGWKFLSRFVCPLAIGWIIYSVIFLGKTYN